MFTSQKSHLRLVHQVSTIHTNPSPRTKHSAVRKGFTLIELLVVIAIIAILAAILFPVFARARSKARQASGASNQKQIALGFLQYIQDYDEQFPPVAVLGTSGVIVPWGPDYTTGPVGGPNVTVPGLLSPYVKSNQLYQDPSGPRPGNALTATAGNTINDYIYNDYLASKSQAALAGVTNTVLTMDGDGQDARGSFGTDGKTYTRPADGTKHGISAGHAIYKVSLAASSPLDITTGAATNAGDRDVVSTTAITRHSDGANVAFTDGHVKWFKIVWDTGDGTTNKGIYFPTRLNIGGFANTTAAVPATGTNSSPAHPACPGGLGFEPVPGGDMCGFGGTFHLN